MALPQAGFPFVAAHAQAQEESCPVYFCLIAEIRKDVVEDHAAGREEAEEE